MINKVSEVKKILIIFSIFLVFGCSGNRFKDADFINSFTFGLFGYDDSKCIQKYEPQFLKTYPSGKYPSRICSRYQRYTCHITHYCPNLPTEVERKKCEHDAAQYWLKPWQDIKTKKFLDKVTATKEICDSEAQKNSQIPVK